MKRSFFPLLSVLLLPACSGAETGPTGEKESKLKTESQFCAAWAIAACNEGVVNACNGTRDGCTDTQKSACQLVVPPGYVSTHAQECIDAVKRAYADAELTAEELATVTQLQGDCARLVDGGLSEGSACTTSFECDGVNGFSCIIKPGEATGTCQLPEETDTGLSCRAPESVCGPDDFCDPDSTRCVTRVDDLPCVFDEACPSDYRCMIADGETEGTCVERLDSGTCTTNEDCKSGLCLGTTRKVCASNVVLTVESSLCDTLR